MKFSESSSENSKDNIQTNIHNVFAREKAFCQGLA